MGGQAGRVWDKEGVSPTLGTCCGGNQEPNIIDDMYSDREPRVTEDCPTLRSERNGLKVAIPVLTPDRADKRQNGRRFKDNGELSFTLTAQDRHGVAVYDAYNKKINIGEQCGTLIAHHGQQNYHIIEVEDETTD